MKKIKDLNKGLMISFVCAMFVSFANVAMLTFNWHCTAEEEKSVLVVCTIVRFFLFWIFTVFLLFSNRHLIRQKSFYARILPNFVLTLIGFGIFKFISYSIHPASDWYIIIQSMQFMLLGVVCLFLGFTDYLNERRKKKEDELHQLRVESLQSRCSALTNQINPHFFFNSLNCISSLVRKKDEKATIQYIDNLSDIFRYILQSESKGLVELAEELEFARSFSEVMQKRYAGKLDIEFDIPEEYMNRSVPVLALLPLIENVTVHNMIDSEHKMQVRIYVDNEGQLVVSNPIYAKSYRPETHGTGIKNLNKRFLLLLDKEIKLEQTDGMFKVIMPLG